MATWVEDIVQAMKNLGGEAHRRQIINEVARIRKVPLPESLVETIQRTIQNHSSDSIGFRGNDGDDLFRKVGNGVWALRGQEQITPSPQPIPNPVPPHLESFDEISNILRTIKQYRDYQHPDSSSRKEYVKEFFHILGFSTEELNPRLFTLNVMGANHAPKAIVGFIHPSEDFEKIIQGISWESYLLFAANYYHIGWGILTNRLQLRIINYKDSEREQHFYWSDLDGIILNEKLDTFFNIYKVISAIKGRKTETVKREIGRKPKGDSKSGKTEFDLEYHTHHKPEYTIQLFKALRPLIFSLSSSITESNNKMYMGYSSGKNFCEIHFQMKRVIIWVCISVDEISSHYPQIRDVRNIGHYGTGKTEIILDRAENVGAVFDIIKQAYNHSTN